MSKIKSKSWIRLLNLLRFEKHKRIRSNSRLTQKKINFFSGISQRPRNLRSKAMWAENIRFIKKERLNFYESFPKMPLVVESASEDIPKACLRILKKNKYKLGSYLFNVICKFPRKYFSHSLGKEVLRRYHTMPARLSLTRFISNRFLKTYYQDFKKGSRTEQAGKFLSRLEQALDSTLLRVLQFRSLYTIKRVNRKRKKLSETGLRYPRYEIKSPTSNYASSQIRQ